MIDSRGVADLWGVHPDTARRHLRARFGAGQSFDVPGQSSFRIRVTGEPYHYVCHFG